MFRPTGSWAGEASNEPAASSSPRRSCLVALPALADNYVLRVATTMLMYSCLGARLEFHRRLRRISVLRHRRILRARRLCRRRAADQGRAHGGGMDPRRRHRRAVRGGAGARDPAFARALFRHRQPGGGRGAARDHQFGDRSDRRRHGIEPAGPGDGRDQSDAVVLLRHVRRRGVGARDGGARRPQPIRLRPALHPAERGCRHRARRQRSPLQGGWPSSCRRCFRGCAAASTPPGSTTSTRSMSTTCCCR